MSITYTAPSTPLAKITRDHDTQSRVRLDSDVVAEYAAAMAEGVQFPPVVVFNEGETFWLADGFHRVAAAEQAGKDVIAAEVRQGSKRDAILYSVGVNAQHGLRRSNGDKRRAVEVLLKDDEWRKWADREIARRAGVDHKTVGALRSELAARGEIPQIEFRAVTRGAQAYAIETDTSYPATPSSDADVEAARLLALRVVTYFHRDSLLDRLHAGDNQDYPEGWSHLLGEGVLNGQKVTRKQIGIALTTANGSGVYRFDAVQLWDWNAGRAEYLAKPETFDELYDMYQRTEGYSKEARTLIKFGLALLSGPSGSYITLTATARAWVEDELDKRPLLKTCTEIAGKYKLRATTGPEILKKIAKVNKGGEWHLGGTWYYQSETWIPALVEAGLLTAATRVADDDKPVVFYAVSPACAQLLGVEFPPLSELPDLPYSMRGECFVPPDAVHKFSVGDRFAGHDSLMVVEALEPWPLYRLRRADDASGTGWRPVVSEFDLTPVAAGEVQTVKTANGERSVTTDSANALLDKQTFEVLSCFENLIAAVRDWSMPATAADVLISIRTGLGLVMATDSGQRVLDKGEWDFDSEDDDGEDFDDDESDDETEDYPDHDDDF